MHCSLKHFHFTLKVKKSGMKHKKEMHASCYTEMSSYNFFDKQSPCAVPVTRSFYLLVTVFTTATSTRDNMDGSNTCDILRFIMNELFR